MQCSAFTRSGRPCRNPTLTDMTVCHVHKPDHEDLDLALQGLKIHLDIASKAADQFAQQQTIQSKQNAAQEEQELQKEVDAMTRAKEIISKEKALIKQQKQEERMLRQKKKRQEKYKKERDHMQEFWKQMANKYPTEFSEYSLRPSGSPPFPPDQASQKTYNILQTQYDKIKRFNEALIAKLKEQYQLLHPSITAFEKEFNDARFQYLLEELQFGSSSLETKIPEETKSPEALKQEETPEDIRRKALEFLEKDIEEREEPAEVESEAELESTTQTTQPSPLLTPPSSPLPSPSTSSFLPSTRKRKA